MLVAQIDRKTVDGCRSVYELADIDPTVSLMDYILKEGGCPLWNSVTVVATFDYNFSSNEDWQYELTNHIKPTVPHIIRASNFAISAGITPDLSTLEKAFISVNKHYRTCEFGFAILTSQIDSLLLKIEYNDNVYLLPRIDRWALRPADFDNVSFVIRDCDRYISSLFGEVDRRRMAEILTEYGSYSWMSSNTMRALPIPPVEFIGSSLISSTKENLSEICDDLSIPCSSMTKDEMIMAIEDNLHDETILRVLFPLLTETAYYRYTSSQLSRASVLGNVFQSVGTQNLSVVGPGNSPRGTKLYDEPVTLSVGNIPDGNGQNMLPFILLQGE